MYLFAFENKSKKKVNKINRFSEGKDANEPIWIVVALSLPGEIPL